MPTTPEAPPPTEPPTDLEVLGQALPRAEPDALAALARHGARENHSQGALLCRRGEQEDRFILILGGQVDVFAHQDAGREFLASMGPGAMLGGLEYFTEAPRVADVVASEPVTTLELGHAALDEIVRQHPALLKELTRVEVGKLLHSQSRLLTLAAATRDASDEHEVFLSYARTDTEFVRRLANGLRRLGVSLWVDVFGISPGRSWARQIGEALDRCSLMVLVLSPRSLASENVEDEWNYYLDRKKAVIPVLFERATIPYRLNMLQYVDFAGQPFDDALTQLTAAIRGTEPKAAGA